METAVAVRCLVGFYGLNRSLRWTAKSIRKNILQPLFEAGAEVRCIAHFNEPRKIHNEHSSEFNLPTTRRGIGQLPLDALLIEEQNESQLPRAAVDSADRILSGRAAAERATWINLLRQLYSLKQLWRLAHLTPADYDVFLFFRPDLEYLDRLKAEQLFEQVQAGHADLITASWHQWGGLNDRFAFCSRKGAEVYAQRIDFVEQFCAEKMYLNAEHLLSLAAARSNLRLRYTNLRAMRIRADGSTLREDFDLNPIVFARGVARKRIHRVRTALGRLSSV
jgi:hypothetical protein